MPPGLLAPTVLVISTLVALISGCADRDDNHTAELVFTGGAVYTVDARRSWASAVAVTDGRIVYVGDDAGAIDHIGDGTRVIDLSGRMLLPGFHDSHMHPMSGGTRMLRCQLGGLDWPDEVHAAIRDCVADWSGGEWFRGIGLTEQAFDGMGPEREVLDELVPDRPAFITTDEGFLAWVNSRVLKIAGIGASTLDPPKGKIERDPVTGIPSGTMRQSASGLIWMAVPKPGAAIYRKVLKMTIAEANSHGITSVNDARVSQVMLEAYLEADRAGELNIRIQTSLGMELPSFIERIGVDEGMAKVKKLIPLLMNDPDHRVRVDAVKLFVDGGFNNSSAAMLKPYETSDSDRGTLRFEVEALNSMVELLDASGFQVHIHAVGDRAVRVGLDAIERAIDINGARDRRHQLAHIKLINPVDLGRFQELGITANFQPLWAKDDRNTRQEIVLLGDKRSTRLMNIASVKASGARIVAGSDWPSESMSPLYSIQVAITRQPVDGSEAPWLPEERMGLAGMLEAYTINGAWLSRSDSKTGSIEVDKAADLIVLEQNLFEVDPMEIHKVSVLLTLLDGELVYRDPDFNW